MVPGMVQGWFREHPHTATTLKRLHWPSECMVPGMVQGWFREHPHTATTPKRCMAPGMAQGWFQEHPHTPTAPTRFHWPSGCMVPGMVRFRQPSECMAPGMAQGPAWFGPCLQHGSARVRSHWGQDARRRMLLPSTAGGWPRRPRGVWAAPAARLRAISNPPTL